MTLEKILPTLPLKYLSLKIKYSITTWLLFMGYILLLLFFSQVDVYHQHFFSTRWIVTLYNLFRISFIFYLMWLCYVLGDYVLYFFTHNIEHRAIKLESFVLTFFAGVSAWHILLLMLGFAGLYQHIIMVVITVSLLIASLPRFDKLIQYGLQKKSSLYSPGLWLFLAPAFLFLITKGLYPSGGHDYFTHYFPYYREVIESGSILPGRLWYHFYYDKGMGLFFLSMLLTDPLAPQLVTTAMLFASAGIVFSLIRQASSWHILPWIAVAFYIAFLIYTPGSPEAMHETGWGELEKSHEPASILMFSIIWLTIRLAEMPHWKLGSVALILNAAALAIMSIATAVFTNLYLSIMMLAMLFYNKSAAVSVFKAFITAGLCIIVLLLANYLLTGLPDEQSFRIWWPFVNLNKVNQWGGLLQVANLYSTRVAQNAPKISIGVYLFSLIIKNLRLDILGPLFIFILLGLTTKVKQVPTDFMQATKEAQIALVILCGFLLLMACTFFIVGHDQKVSFYRFTSFTYAPALCFGMLLVASFFSEKKKLAYVILFLSFIYGFSILANTYKHHLFRFIITMPMAVILLTILVNCLCDFSKFKSKYVLKCLLCMLVGASLFIFIPLHYPKNFFRIVTRGARFITGQYSISNAYQDQKGWPGRMDWGAIYPPLEIIWHHLPPKTRIWSWHIHSYCMLPDCDVESFTSFQMSPHETSVYFGDPKEAKTMLKKENLNYFFFSSVLDIKDPLSRSSLFSPEHIADFLGIAWTDGYNTLLTWKEEAHQPIDTHWLNIYAKRVDEGSPQYPYDKIKNLLGFPNKQTWDLYLRSSKQSHLYIRSSE